MIKVRNLDKEFVIQVYHEHLVKDFIPAEQKPLDIITGLMDRGLYICYGLYDEEEFVAYAFFMKVEGYQDLLIDYFAVCSEVRSCGYGSRFLSLLASELTEYDNIIFEVESGKDAKDEQELAVCKKRLEFYHRNGLKDTKLKVSLFGCDMVILYLQLHKAPTDDSLEEALDAIYDTMFGKDLHKRCVIVSRVRE
ncbi:MAG: GNAT family N-acetyltransferase [Clostridiales bacterium]|nr:GNAT family N-acetyltransferase [Clostridiales bacterium]